MTDQIYAGLIIRSHAVKDAESKAVATNSLTNWQQVSLSASDWIRELEAGRTIQPSVFSPKSNGTFTHAKEFWHGTHFVCCDADNIQGVEFLEDGSDKNPEGVEAWQDEKGLSKLYPTLQDKVFAVGQSVSSMSNDKPPPHRRYRLIFIFDELITEEKHYHQFLKALSKEFGIIPDIERSPAQPVFGNARANYNKFAIPNNTLLLKDYPHTTPKSEQKRTVSSTKPVSLAEYLDQHCLPYTQENDKYFVECPFKHHHTGGVCKPKDAYVFENTEGKFAYHCSHTSCKSTGRTTWEAFREAHGIRKREWVDTAGKPKQSSKGVDFVGDTPLYTDDDIETDTGEDALMEFPQELFFGVFKDFRDAHLDRVPISDSFAFSGLKHAIASILGRKIYLDTSPLVFPNMYTAFIGGSSDTAKGNALRQSRDMLRDSAPNVLTLSGLATPEGLLNQFVKPAARVDEVVNGNGETEERTVYSGGFADGMNDPEKIMHILGDMSHNESARVSGYFGEFGAILRKAAKMNATGLLELIMQLYDAEPNNDSPTKTNRTVAEYPTFSIIAATDIRLIETVLKDAYISGGFTNRFEWYLGKRVQKRFLNNKVSAKHWNACVQVVGGLRNKFGEGNDQIAFGITAEAYDLGQAFTDQLSNYLNSETMSDTMIADSLKRTDMHVLKNALIFSVILNKPDDRTISIEAVELAIRLAEFTTHCTRLIFKDFATTVNKQVEDKIMNYLRKKPKSSLGVIANRTRIDTQTLEKALDSLVRTHRVVRIKGDRKPQYAVVKEETI